MLDIDVHSHDDFVSTLLFVDVSHVHHHLGTARVESIATVMNTALQMKSGDVVKGCFRVIWQIWMRFVVSNRDFRFDDGLHDCHIATMEM